MNIANNHSTAARPDDAVRRGTEARERGALHEALQLFLLAIEQGQRIGDRVAMALALERLGELYAHLTDYVKGLDHYQRALSLYEELDDPAGAASTLHSIGLLYGDCHDYESAHEFLARSLEVFHDIGDRTMEVRALMNLGAVHSERGDLEKARDCALRTLTVYQALGDRTGAAAALLHVGEIYGRMQQHDIARHVRLQALEVLEEVRSRDLLARALLSVGKSYREAGDLEAARFVMEQGVAAAREINDHSTIYGLYGELAGVLEDLGDYPAALDFHRRYVQAMQDQFGRDKQRSIAELRMRFDLERVLKDEEIRRRNDVMRAVVETQEAERFRIAGDLHDSVGQWLAAAKINLPSTSAVAASLDPHSLHAYDRALHAIDCAAHDVRTIAHSLFSNTLRECGLVVALREMVAMSGNSRSTRFGLSVHNMDERLPEYVELVLFRIAQELVTNIIKHARASTATVDLLRRADHVVLMIVDDGIGYDAGASGSNGMGRRNIETRVRTLNGRIEFDSSPGHGATVTVEVPVL